MKKIFDKNIHGNNKWTFACDVNQIKKIYYNYSNYKKKIKVSSERKNIIVYDSSMIIWRGKFLCVRIFAQKLNYN